MVTGTVAARTRPFEGRVRLGLSMPRLVNDMSWNTHTHRKHGLLEDLKTVCFKSYRLDAFLSNQSLGLPRIHHYTLTHSVLASVAVLERRQGAETGRDIAESSHWTGGEVCQVLVW